MVLSFRRVVIASDSEHHYNFRFLGEGAAKVMPKET
jgi:hypothetical protein